MYLNWETARRCSIHIFTPPWAANSQPWRQGKWYLKIIDGFAVNNKIKKPS
jgi:hypothetical protein